MKIKYEFATETIELEVSEEWTNILIDLDRQEYNVNHKETRRHCSLEAYNLDDNLLASELNVEAEVLKEDKRRELMEAIEKLSPDQRELIQAIFFEGISVSEYARRKGVSQPAVTQRKDTVLKTLKKFLS